MAKHEFQVLTSKKAGLVSKESFIVERGGHVFLRLLGKEPVWEIMTATAGEDSNIFTVCPDQLRLIETARAICVKRDFDPTVKIDWAGREYVKMADLLRRDGETDGELSESLHEFIDEFFDLFDAYRSIDCRARDEMIDLYDVLSNDDLGGDVYLGDGVWLTRDGSTEDRGR